MNQYVSRSTLRDILAAHMPEFDDVQCYADFTNSTKLEIVARSYAGGQVRTIVRWPRVDQNPQPWAKEVADAIRSQWSTMTGSTLGTTGLRSDLGCYAWRIRMELDRKRCEHMKTLEPKVGESSLEAAARLQRAAAEDAGIEYLEAVAFNLEQLLADHANEVVQPPACDPRVESLMGMLRTFCADMEGSSRDLCRLAARDQRSVQSFTEKDQYGWAADLACTAAADAASARTLEMWRDKLKERVTTIMGDGWEKEQC